MAAKKPLTVEQQQTLMKIRKFEHLKDAAHARRDEEIIIALALGIPRRLIANAAKFGSATSVSAIASHPHKLGARRPGWYGDHVQNSE